MNGALEHECRAPFRYNSRGSTPQRRDPSAARVTCWHCGQRGHYSTECPNPPTDISLRGPVSPYLWVVDSIPDHLWIAICPVYTRCRVGVQSISD